MEGLRPPKTIKVYQLTKMTITSGIYISPVSSYSGTPSYGMGIFKSLDEAEQNRTIEILKDKTDDTSYHIFELEFPNPAYQE
jgi:hypothetical protein